MVVAQSGRKHSFFFFIFSPCVMSVLLLRVWLGVARACSRERERPEPGRLRCSDVRRSESADRFLTYMGRKGTYMSKKEEDRLGFFFSPVNGNCFVLCPPPRVPELSCGRGRGGPLFFPSFAVSHQCLCMPSMQEPRGMHASSFFFFFFFYCRCTLMDRR